VVKIKGSYLTDLESNGAIYREVRALVFPETRRIAASRWCMYHASPHGLSVEVKRSRCCRPKRERVVRLPRVEKVPVAQLP